MFAQLKYFQLVTNKYEPLADAHIEVEYMQLEVVTIYLKLSNSMIMEDNLVCMRTYDPRLPA